MKQQNRTRPPIMSKPDPGLNKSFEGPKRGHLSTSQDMKNHAHSKDVNKINMQKNFMDYVRKSVLTTEDNRITTNTSKVMKAYQPKTLPNMENSVRYESDRHNESFKESANMSFLKSSIKTKKKAKENLHTSFARDDSRTKKRADTVNAQSVSPKRKNNDLINQSFCFLTYDEIPQKKAFNYAKLDNRGSVKHTGQLQRSSNSAMRGSRIPNSNDHNKSVNKTFRIEVGEKLKSSPSQKPSKNKFPPETETTRRALSRGKSREEGSRKKSKKHLISENNHHHSSTDDFSKAAKKKISSNNERKTSEERKVKKEKVKVSKHKEKENVTIGLTEKEMLDMNSNLSAYYDKMMGKDNSNSKIIHNLKDNFDSLIKEFMKNYQMIKHYNGFKKKYDEEKEKAQKEREKLEFKLNVLQTENSRLKDLNLKYIKGQGQETNADESFLKSRDTSFISKDAHEAPAEEKKLKNLLAQRDKFINFMKEKENKYIALINAIQAKGINVDKIYEEEVSRINYTQEDEETRLDTVSDADLTSKFDPSYRNAVLPERAKAIKDYPPQNEKDSGFIRKSHFSSTKPKNKEPPLQNDEPPKYGQEYWERQFTEASDSKTISQYSQSIFSYRLGQEQSVRQYISCSPLEKMSTYYNESNNRDLESKTEDEIVDSTEPKGKFKLDLSSIHQNVIKQYHDEFMEKWAEFTSSWKRAMEKDKTFDHQQKHTS